jgi:hypothetical protein
VRAAQIADESSGFGGEGYATVSSVVTEADGGSFMTMVDIYTYDSTTLDLTKGVAQPDGSWMVKWRGCCRRARNRTGVAT